MKAFIKESLRKALLSEKIELNSTEVKKLVNLGINDFFEGESMAKKHLAKVISSINKLPNLVTLYRVVFLNNKKDLNTNQLGSHYVLSRNGLEQSHHQISHVGGGRPYILTVKAQKSLIDVQNTLMNRMKYPHENEITLSNKGAGAQLIRIEEFNPGDDDDDLVFNDFDEYAEY